MRIKHCVEVFLRARHPHFGCFGIKLLPILLESHTPQKKEAIGTVYTRVPTDFKFLCRPATWDASRKLSKVLTLYISLA